MKICLRFHTIIVVALIVFLIQSCTSPKAYQKIYLNDAQMELSASKAEKFENNAHVYREGASGASGGKSGGGCGCN